MPARKRKSSAVVDATSQDLIADTRSTSPNATRRKRSKKVAVTASQQLQTEQEDAELENTQVEEHGNVEEDQVVLQKKLGKGLAISVEKPHTPPDTLSPDTGHPPANALSTAIVVTGTTTNARRASNSPAPARQGRQQVGRASPPPALQDGATELHFSPLREVIEQRAHRRTRSSQLAHSSDIEEVTTGGAEDVSLVDPADLDMTIEATLPPPTIVVMQQAPIVRPDPTSGLEVQKFEQVTTTLHHDIAAVKAALEILVTELKTLGFAEAGAGTDVILANIRTAYREARTQLNQLLPNADVNSHANGELLQLMISNIRGLLITIDEQTQTIRQAKDDEHVLKAQHNGLLDKIEKLEHRKSELQKNLHTTDMLADKRAKDIMQLEEQTEVLQAAYEKRGEDIEERDNAIADLSDDLATEQDTANRMARDLDSTKDSVERLEAALATLEQGYKQSVVEMQQTHATAINSLDAELEAEQQAREAAESDDADKARKIAELETEVGDLNGDMETLRIRLAESKEANASQIRQSESLETELKDQHNLATELKLKLEAAEGKLETLNAELEELRGVVASERRQREAAEAELDQRNENIEGLNMRLKEAGMQANELRGKLFEAQQRREKEVKELQDSATADRNRYQTLLTDEEDAHAASKERIDELTETITDLEAKIEDVIKTSKRLEAARDATIAEKQKEIDGFQTAIKKRDERHTQYVERKGEEVQSLRKDLAQLTTILKERGSELDAAKLDIVQLEKDKESLERRVESEALALLEEQNGHADAIAGLNESLKARDVEIGKLLRERQVSQEEQEETLLVRDERIHNLEELVESRLVEVETLEHDNTALKEKLTEVVKTSRQAISRVNAIQAAAHSQSQEEEQKLLHDTETIMHDVDVISTPTTVVRKTSNYVPQRRSGRAQRQTKSAKKTSMSSANHDSGIFGVSSDVESTQEMEEVGAA